MSNTNLFPQGYSDDPTQIIMALTSLAEKDEILELLHSITIHGLLDPDDSFGPEGRSSIYAFYNDMKNIFERAYTLRSEIISRDREITEKAAKTESDS